MRTLRIGILTSLLLAAICPISSVSATERTITVDSFTVIQSPDSLILHVLAKPFILFPDSTATIEQAILNLWVMVQTEDTAYVSVRLYPLTRDWDPYSVDWFSPWSAPGGDYSDINYAEYSLLTVGEQRLQIDLTDLFTRWAEGSIPYFGFLLEAAEGSLAPVSFMNGEHNKGPFGVIKISYTWAGME